MQHNSTNAGFSLVELLVSLMLFTVVVTIAVGTLLTLIDSNTKARNMQDALTNLQFALDSMTREIRTGTNYYCGGNVENNTPAEAATRDCEGGASAFAFLEGGQSLTSGGNGRISYRLENERIERRIGTGSWEPLTSQRVRITELRFVTRDTDDFLTDGDTTQPTVTLFVSGEAGQIPGLDTSFSLQTSLTQRVRDISADVD